MRRTEAADPDILSGENILSVPHGQRGPDYGIGASLMSRMGHSAGRGLGAREQGMTEPLQPSARPYRSGIGAEPSSSSTDRPNRVTKFKRQPVPRPSPEHQRAVKMSHLAVLRRIRASLDLDPVAFVSEFARSSLWSDYRLWEVPLATIQNRFRDATLQDFETNAEDLKRCVTYFPAPQWARFLETTWVPRMLENDLDNFLYYLNFFSEYDFIDFKFLETEPNVGQPFMNRVLEHAREILNNEDYLEQTLFLLPRFSLEARKLPLNYTPEEKRALGCAYDLIETEIQRNSDLVTTVQLVRMNRGLLPTEESNNIIDRYMMPQWFEELTYRAMAGRLKRSWFDEHREFLNRDWTLRGLNRINSILDFKGLPPSDSYGHMPSTPTLAETLDHYCYMQGYTCQFLSDERGTISAPSTQVETESTMGSDSESKAEPEAGPSVSWQLIDDVLHVTDQLVPISFDEIKNYL